MAAAWFLILMSSAVAKLNGKWKLKHHLDYLLIVFIAQHAAVLLFRLFGIDRCDRVWGLWTGRLKNNQCGSTRLNSFN